MEGGRLFELIEAHPVDLHLNGEIGGINRTYPVTAELHVEQQIEGLVEGELTFEVGLDAGIGEGVSVVDEEAEAVGVHLNGKHVIVIRLDGAGGIVRRYAVHLESNSIIGMNSLISDSVVVEALHYVDFATVGPLGIAGAGFRDAGIGKHPESGPFAAATLKFGSDFDTAVFKRLFVF